MAKAQINKMVIETPVQVTVTQMKTEEKQTGVRLDLTMAEAETLRVILHRIGGNSQKSPRKYTQRIVDALSDAGVVWDSEHYAVEEERGAIYFLNYPKASKVAPVDPLKGEPEPGAGFTGCNTTKPALPTIFQVGDVVLVNKQLTVINRGERAKVTSLGRAGGYFLSTIGCHTKEGFAEGKDLTLVTAAHPLSNL